MIFTTRMLAILVASLIATASQYAFADSGTIVERCMGQAAKLVPDAHLRCIDGHPVTCTLVLKTNSYGTTEPMVLAQEEAARCVEQAGFQKRKRDYGATYHSTDGKRKISFDHWTLDVVPGSRKLEMWTYIPWGTVRTE